MRKILKCGLLCIIFVALCFAACLSFGKNAHFTYADGDNDISIFIRNPSYSIYYNKKVYFIDESDNMLKVYNTETSKFEDEDDDYIELSTYNLSSDNLVTASFWGGHWYFIYQKEAQNGLLEIDLANMTIFVHDLSFSTSYDKLFTQKITFDSKDYILYSLSSSTPNLYSPKLYLYSLESESFEVINLTFNNELAQVNNTMVKTISYQNSDGDLYLIFIYGSTVAHCQVISTKESLLQLNTNPISTMTYSENPLETINSDFIIVDVNVANISDRDYIVISYKNVSNADKYLSLYDFNFNGLTAVVTWKKDFSCKKSTHVNINNNFYTYTDGQTIYYVSITREINPDTSAETFPDDSSTITNPAYNISYYNADNFVYKRTTKNTELYDNPWGAESNVQIVGGYNVVVIGQAYIQSDNSLIADYDYCMYTSQTINNFGFIKKFDLAEKSAISVADAGYSPRVTVWPNTILYSLPTTVTSGQINDSNLVSKIILNIENNSPIEILDVLCDYVANSVRMLKVKVNGQSVGYIKAESVIKPSKTVDFVITNATIKNDGTIVYLSPNSSATKLNFTLNKDKNIRINGKRNEFNGFTSITFNDEYGNEFSGYIQTDYVNADAWSTLQIVGSILIAINVGLLILILVYKKKHLSEKAPNEQEDKAI